MKRSKLTSSTPTAITNAGILRGQVDRLISEISTNRDYWYVTTLRLDIHVLALLPWHRELIGFSCLDWRAVRVSTPPFIDIRLMADALRPFDPHTALEITFPRTDDQMFKFQQGDLISLVASLTE